MQRITLQIPETLNDGTQVAAESFASYEVELHDIAGGFTLTHAIGSWRAPSGAIYRDALRLYAIDVADAQTVLERVLHLADRIRRDLDQEAVYVTVSPIEATLVTELVVA